METKKIKIIFAGGGTGGHLYPAISVAQALKKISPDAEILFLGTKNKIESRVVPSYGFDFRPITISGFSRKINLSNILFPFKLLAGFVQSLATYIKFKPDVVVGTGAYVSGPIGAIAALFGSKLVLLEQNSFPGVTNRILEKRAKKIYIAFEDSKKYFSNKSNLILAGNPVRVNMSLEDKKTSVELFSHKSDKKTILVLGGSLGAGSVNSGIASIVEKLTNDGIQVIWQTGERFYSDYQKYNSDNIKVVPFIENMSAAFSAADLIITRAGATTIAEIAYMGLPAIFIPSTNVAANHQYKNALSLEKADAAYLLPDDKINEKLYPLITEVIKDDNKLKQFSENIKQFSNPEAASNIAEDILKLIE